MAEVTIDQFASSVGISVDRLIGQLKEVGLDEKLPDDTISDGEKTMLLSYLRKMHGKERGGAGTRQDYAKA